MTDQRTVLITTANGMFGHGLAEALADDPDVRVRAMVRDRAKFTLDAPNIDVVVGDLDKPETLAEPMQGVSHVFLSTPMDTRIAEREKAVVDAALAAGRPHVLKIFGAVKHEDDRLAGEHNAAIETLKSSGLPWTLISPTSVMETSLESFAETLAFNCIIGMSGEGKVALVAAGDIARATAAVVRSDGHEGRNYELTGPALVDLYDVCDTLTKVLEREITYYDLPEDEFADLLMKHGDFKDRDEVEIGVVCHLRAWKEGRAEVQTDTFTELTGEQPTPLEDWLVEHRETFDRKPGVGDRIAGFFIHRQYAKYAGRPAARDSA